MNEYTNKPSNKKSFIGFRVPADEKEILLLLADWRNVSLSALMRKVVTEYLEGEFADALQDVSENEPT